MLRYAIRYVFPFIYTYIYIYIEKKMLLCAQIWSSLVRDTVSGSEWTNRSLHSLFLFCLPPQGLFDGLNKMFFIK